MTIRIDEKEILTSSARTGTPEAVDLTYNGSGASGMRNENIRNLRVVVDVTAEEANASLQVKVTGSDPSSGSNYVLLAGNNIITTGTYFFDVGVDVETVSGESKKTFLPASLKVHFEHADTKNITYSASAVAQFDTYK